MRENRSETTKESAFLQSGMALAVEPLPINGQSQRRAKSRSTELGRVTPN
jgi:hypothetical protein